MGLQDYRRKRQFTRTTEPKGGRAHHRTTSRRFVIQKHAATRLHYDLRLELGGVLKSWAVPKGPSINPADKRLAVEVEDHPLEYAQFEGQIPAGNYGAGEVIVWDQGTWTSQADPAQGLRAGNLEFELEGEKLHGGWRLVRLGRNAQKSRQPQWLLMKRSDDFAQADASSDILVAPPESVLSGRQLPLNQPRGAQARPPKSSKRNPRTGPQIDPSQTLGARPAAMPKVVPPQLASAMSVPPRGKEWLHEVKFDGYRLVAYVQHGNVELRTRGQQDWTARYPPIAQGLARLPVQTAVLDGEVVALLPSGVSSFQALQNALGDRTPANLAYYVFDLLYLDGYDLRGVALVQRKQLLQRLLESSALPQIQFSEHAEQSGPALFEESCKMGLEGIVSKRKDRPYVSGRSGDWAKCKCLDREEMVIGGYTPSTSADREFGALLVGYFTDGRLTYAGRVGTGFTAEMVHDLHQRMQKLRQPQSPFDELPAREHREQVQWVRPELVGQIEFTGWTESNVMRHPSFQGLREDKPAKVVEAPPSLPSNRKTPPKAKGQKKLRRKARAPAPVQLPENLRLTHPQRILYPDIGLTKLALAEYYARVAEWMLPHVVNRPLSLVRCPGGQPGPCFFQKHAVAGTPDVLGRITIAEKNEAEEYLFVRDAAGLVALAQISVLEVHVWGARCDQVERPDRLVIDLDPHETVSWPQVIAAAGEVREMLRDMGLVSFVKTTGGKGLHIVVPLAPRRHTWERTKQFTRTLAELLVERTPDRYTANMTKAGRRGKIFVDYLRNGRGATAVAPYSPRARPGAPVATPVDWNELRPSLTADYFNLVNLVERLQSLQRDPWDGIDSIRQTLPT